jgi:SAM-dependent methyltransferase
MAGPEGTTIDQDVFQNLYAEGAAWDIGRPQPVFVSAAAGVAGSVLDVGCGTGENGLYFASRGCMVTGVDLLEHPIALAKRKANDRGLSATFRVADALKLGEWAERFDNAIDSGLFHIFSDEDRIRYILGLSTILKPGGRLFLLCFSDLTQGAEGPRRVSERELRAAFREGWEIERLERGEFEIRPEVRDTRFSGQNPKAWFMVARRLPEGAGKRVEKR